METIEIEKLEELSQKTRQRAIESHDCITDAYMAKVIQLANYAKLLERKLRRSKNPMNESMSDELSEMTALAKEQRQLLDTAAQEVGKLGKVIIANQIEKQGFLTWNAAAVVVIKRFCTLDEREIMALVLKTAQEMHNEQ